MNMKYPVIDWHCDALLKLQENQDLDFYDSDALDVNVVKLRKGGVKVQAFAIFIDPEIPWNQKYDAALTQVKMYKEKVLSQEGFVQIRSFREIHDLEDDEIGTFLTLEGLDCVDTDINKVQHLLDEGVLSIGMTWNNANLACDGIGEKRGAGVTEFGLEVIELMNKNNLFIDVSHISLKGFEDVLDNATHVIASHSNAQTIASHRRNLNDAQIKRMKAKEFPIHLVYCEPFIVDLMPAKIDDLIKHVDYFIKQGYELSLGLGSDFDGIFTKVENLEDSSDTQNMLKAIENQFGSEVAMNIAYSNFMRYVDTHMNN